MKRLAIWLLLLAPSVALADSGWVFEPCVDGNEAPCDCGSFAGRRTCVGARYGACVCDPNRAWPRPPAPPRKRDVEEPGSRAKMRDVGIALTAAGGVTAAGGGITACALYEYGDCHDTCLMPLFVGVPIIGTGALLLVVGIPLWVVGAGRAATAPRAGVGVWVTPRTAGVRGAW